MGSVVLSGMVNATEPDTQYYTSKSTEPPVAAARATGGIIGPQTQEPRE